MEQHGLSDGDIDKIAEKLEERLVRRFHVNLGKGLWGFAWRGIVIAVIALAIYGASFKGWR